MSLLVLVLAALVGFAPSSALAQTKKAAQVIPQISHEVAVSAVTISVTVQDRGGRYVNDLTQDDFAVYENNIPREISYFKHDFEAPLSLTVLLDVSGSMALQDKLAECKKAILYLLRFLLRADDEVSLLIFADSEVEVAVPFTTDRILMIETLEKIEAYGQTALNDAVAVSPEYANKGRNEKRALLLFTDGIENDSLSTVDQALEIARRVDVPIYTIGYKIPRTERFLQKYKTASGLTALGIVETLKRFSRTTGGTALFFDEYDALGKSMLQLSRELRHQYLIGYTTYTASGGEFRYLRVATPKKNYRVRTREGY
jgi:Ca-activated chloride channel family protein